MQIIYFWVRNEKCLNYFLFLQLKKFKLVWFYLYLYFINYLFVTWIHYYLEMIFPWPRSFLIIRLKWLMELYLWLWELKKKCFGFTCVIKSNNIHELRVIIPNFLVNYVLLIFWLKVKTLQIYKKYLKLEENFFWEETPTIKPKFVQSNIIVFLLCNLF